MSHKYQGKLGSTPPKFIVRKKDLFEALVFLDRTSVLNSSVSATRACPATQNKLVPTPMPDWVAQQLCICYTSFPATQNKLVPTPMPDWVAQPMTV